MLGIDDAALAEIAIAVAEALVRLGTPLLKGDPEKKAFQASLAESLSDFKALHPGWYASLFDSGFLRRKGAPVLARAVMRDGPTATELARAYESSVSSVRLSRDRFEEAQHVAADFLLRLDLALRDKPEFRPHFNSRALDSAVRYLSALVETANASWASNRAELVDKHLEMFITAVETYRLLGETLAKGRELEPLDEVDARVSAKKAVFGLGRMKYPESDALQKKFIDLVLARYEELAGVILAGGPVPKALLNLRTGCDAMYEELCAAPPI